MSAAQSIVSGLAGRYATALYELAVDAKAVDGLEQDMAGLRALLGESEDLRRLVTSPRLARQAQAKAVTAVAQAAGLSDLVVKFLGTLAMNRRLSQLEKVMAAVAKLIAHHRGEITAQVRAARPLSDAQRQKLSQSLKATVGRDVALDEQVDQSLIGGLIVRVGSRQFDGSVKTKLDRVERAMKGV